MVVPGAGAGPFLPSCQHWAHREESAIGLSHSSQSLCLCVKCRATCRQHKQFHFSTKMKALCLELTSKHFLAASWPDPNFLRATFKLNPGDLLKYWNNCLKERRGDCFFCITLNLLNLLKCPTFQWPPTLPSHKALPAALTQTPPLRCQPASQERQRYPAQHIRDLGWIAVAW